MFSLLHSPFLFLLLIYILPFSGGHPELIYLNVRDYRSRNKVSRFRKLGLSGEASRADIRPNGVIIPQPPQAEC